MKEKRVDIYLAEAGWGIMMLIGFGGTFLNEIIDDEPRLIVELSTSIPSIIAIVIARRQVSKARSLTKKSKRKHNNNE
jgi:hypothetical protein